MSTKFLSPGWRMPRNANQSKSSNYSMNFDGSSYINAGNDSSLTPTNGISISLWIKTNDGGSYRGLIDKWSPNNGYMIDLGASGVNQGKPRFTIGQSAITASVAVNDGSWHHVVVTCDNTTGYIYVDGVQTGTGSLTLSGISTSQNLCLMGDEIHPPSTYKTIGQMDAVSIFDYALSSSQVIALYGDSTNGPGNPMALPRTPVAYYPLGTSAWNGQYLAENNAIGDYVFDFNSASSDNIDCGNNSSFNITSALTLSAWVKLSSATTNQFYISKRGSGDAYQISSFSNKAAGMSIWIGGSRKDLIGTTNHVQDVWYHVVGTYDGSNMRIYLNGVEENSVAQTGAIDTTTAKLILGAYDGSGYSFDGEISNAAIFNTALSATEIETLYNYGSPIRTLANIPQNSNLKAWYKLDASEIYNSTSIEWSVDNNATPTAFKSSLSFDGAIGGAFINCGNDSSLNITSALSISGWFNTSDSTDYRMIITKDSGNSGTRAWLLTMYANGGGTLTFRVFGSDGTSPQVDTTNSYNDGKWHFFTATYEPGIAIKIYVDNDPVVSKNTGIPSAIVSLSSQDVKIGTYGNYDGGGGRRWNGQLSNMQIYNTTISASDVATLYNNGTPLTDMSSFSSLVSWWKLNNTTTGIEDSKGSNNGTNNGATEYAGFVNVLAGDSSVMSQSNLVQSNLQTVAPYSKYAMSFDSASSAYIDVTNFTLSGDRTVSFWVNFGQAPYGSILEGVNGDTYYSFFSGGNLYFRNGTGDTATSLSYGTVNANEWYHFCITGDGTTATVYKNGSSLGTLGDKNITIYYLNGKVFGIDYLTNNGKLSNIAIWNTIISPSQVREVYNEGLPGNLNTFSGTAPIHWWQLGENSSYGSDWICADEMPAGNNGEGQNLAETALTNGVGTTANGVSNGMGVGALVGDAPYSTANAISSGMAVTAKGSDVPLGIKVDFLVIAGGGGGGSDFGSGWGGGGGAGGYRNSYNNETSGGGSSAENNLLLSANTNYTVTVGNGGAGDTNGQDSVFATITSVGGGAGGASPTDPANSGGSGGGAARNNIGGNGTGTANQGFDGSTRGGGGGAGSAGGSGVGYGYPHSPLADGGIGLESSITGTAVKRGGGGSAPYGGAGAWGGGEAPDGGTSSSGTPNTGGGGAGKRNSGTGASGGSGVVILRYSNLNTITVGSGLTTTGEQSDGDDKYIVFTAGTGSVSFS